MTIECPACSSENISSTTIGIISGKDRNTHICQDCGFKWKRGEECLECGYGQTERLHKEIARQAEQIESLYRGIGRLNLRIEKYKELLGAEKNRNSQTDADST